MENLVYLREAAGLPSLGEQQAILRVSGEARVDPEAEGHRAYFDPKPKNARSGSKLPERENLLKAIRRGAGDVVHIAVPAVLAVSQDDAIRVLEEIISKGASLHIASLGLTIGAGDGVAPLKLALSIAKDAAKARTRKARASRQSKGRAPADVSVRAAALAKEMWEAVGPDGYALHTVKVISEATGISPATLYRAQKAGLFKAREGQPMSIRLALANAAKAKKRAKR